MFVAFTLIICIGLNFFYSGSSAHADCYPLLDPPILVYTGSEPDGEYTRYILAVTNWEIFPDELFDLTAEWGPCGDNVNPSRTWVDIYDSNNDYVYGFCAFDDNSQLQGLWFALPSEDTPPDFVYIIMTDRDEECYLDEEFPTRYVSNQASLIDPQPCALLGGDSDEDGVCGDVDNCPDVFNPYQEDTDGDGIGDACDNCPYHANTGQEDTDENGQGDVCDEIYSERIVEPVAPFSVGSQVPIEACFTFHGNGEEKITTFEIDCFNTYFILYKNGDRVQERDRIRFAYGIPDDLVEYFANAEQCITCDLSEMFDSEDLTAPPDGVPVTYEVEAWYINYIRDPDLGAEGCLVPDYEGDEQCYDIWVGAVPSSRVEVQMMNRLQVSIDIKPGDYPNTINLGSKGVVPVAIFGSEALRADQIDPLSVTLAGATVKLRGKGTPMTSISDINEDGHDDLTVHVSTDTFTLSDADQIAVLQGNTYGKAIYFTGTDTVRIVP
jgi:hypothetical protein